MKNLSLLLLACALALALAPVRVSGMIPGGEEKQESSKGSKNDKPDPTKATEARTEEKQIEAAKEAALQGQGNPDLGNNNEVIEKETTVTWEENVDFQLNPLEQSAWNRLQPAAEVASAAFNELLELPRDEEGNILEPSKQEELRTKILDLLKKYEDQRQAWIAEATSQRLAEVETLEKATAPITFEIVKDLDVSTEENGAVFWTGYTLENQRTAMAYAAEQGKKTIEMTRDGKLLDQLGMYKSDSPILDIDENGPIKDKSKLGDLLFDAVSTKFAQAAHGKVIAVIYKPRTLDEQVAYQRSAYNRIEEPILLEREQRGELVLGKGRVEVPVEITLPALRALIKQNVNQTKRLDLIGRLAAGKFSSEEMEKVHEVLNDSKKEERAAKIREEVAKKLPQFNEFLKKELTLEERWLRAEESHQQTQQAWEAAMVFSKNDPSFWSSWEKAIESAKEAHWNWRDWLEFSKKETRSETNAEQAQMAQEEWLLRLRGAGEKIKPPLKLEEEDQATLMTTFPAGILLPEPTEEDAERLELQRQIKELKVKKKEFEMGEGFCEERPRRSSSNANDLPLEKTIDFNQQIKKHTETWENLVRTADEQRRERLRSTGKEETLFPSDHHHKELFDAWREHDERVLQAREEAVARKEKEELNRRLAANWESDTRRWNVRAKADKLWEAANAIGHLYRQHNQISNYDDPIWREADDAIVKVKKHLEQKLQSTRTEWEQRAEEHPELVKAATKGARALSEAKEQLKKSDRVILELQKEFKDQLYQGKACLRPRMRAATPDEIRRCGESLQEQRKILLKKLEAKEISLENYKQELQRMALKDAKENAPGDQEAWKHLVLESEKVAAFFIDQKILKEEELRQLESITEADRAAEKAFSKERQFLNDVQEKWIAELEELAGHRAAAAKAYFKDDPLPWMMLSPQERYYYNAPIRQAKAAMAPKNRDVALERLEQAREAVRNMATSFTISNADRVRIQQEKEEAYNYLVALLENQLSGIEEDIHANKQKVERVYENQPLWSRPSTKEKKSAMSDLIKSNVAHFHLQTQLAKQKRIADDEKNALSFKEQEDRENAIAALQAEGAEIVTIAVRNYWHALDQEAKGNQEAAKLFTQSKEAREAQVAALIEGDEAGAMEEGRRAEELEEAANKLKKENELLVNPSTDRGHQLNLAEEVWLAALEKGDHATAQKEILKAREAAEKERLKAREAAEKEILKAGAALNYAWADFAKEIGDEKNAELFTQAAKAREAQLAALEKGDHAAAKKEGLKADAALEYFFADEAKKRGDEKEAELRTQIAKAREAQLAALEKGDHATAKKEGLKLYAAWNHIQADEAKKGGYEKLAKLHTQIAKAEEAQLAALEKEEKATPTKSEPIQNHQNQQTSTTSLFQNAKEYLASWYEWIQKPTQRREESSVSVSTSQHGKEENDPNKKEPEEQIDSTSTKNPDEKFSGPSTPAETKSPTPTTAPTDQGNKSSLASEEEKKETTTTQQSLSSTVQQSNDMVLQQKEEEHPVVIILERQFDLPDW